MKVLSIVSGKGGTGKTTTVYELAHMLSRKRRVLAIDTDSQASLTVACFGIDPQTTIADVFAGAKTSPKSSNPLPSGLNLTSAELSLANQRAPEQALNRALAAVAALYDVVVIDTPPYLGIIVANALVASNGVIVTTEAEAMSLNTLKNTLDGIELVKANSNPTLELLGVLPTRYAGYVKHHEQALQGRKAAKLPLMRVAIPRTVRMADAAALHRPITELDPAHSAAMAYERLGQEIERWLRK